MSRLYPGRWNVLVVWEEDGAQVFTHTEPSTYEDAERLCFALGLGVPFEGHRVIRALIQQVA